MAVAVCIHPGCVPASQVEGGPPQPELLTAWLLPICNMAPIVPPYISIERRDGGVAVVTMSKEPVNSMDGAMWEGLHTALLGLEADDSCKAVVFASGLRKDIFTAGNDLRELFAPVTTAERYRTFWVQQNRFLSQVFKSRLVTVAAVRGACPAGGTGLAMCCDARFITPNATMGLNEVALGIPVPRFWAALMVRLTGQRVADDLVLNARMVNAEKAVAVGLADTIVSADELLSVAVKHAAHLGGLPSAARGATKASMREEFCRAWEEYYSGPEPRFGWAMLSTPATIAQMKIVLSRLSSKPSKL